MEMTHAEILERQNQAQDFVMTMLQGTVARFDESLSLLMDFNTSDAGKEISPLLTEWVVGGQKFIATMEEAKLFASLTLKIQRPLTSNDPDFDTDPKKKKVCLVYTENMEINETMFIDDFAFNWMGEDLKMYVSARLWGDGTLQLIERIGEQPW